MNEDERKSHIVNNFNAPVGQVINHVDKLEARFDKDEQMIVQEADDVKRNDVPDSNIQEETNDLTESNIIFKLTTPYGTKISLVKLKEFIKVNFLAHYENINNWVALWRFLKEKALLDRNKKGMQDFIKQMNHPDWFPEERCTDEGMKPYKEIFNLPYDEWNTILPDNESNDRKTNAKGLNNIKILYKRLLDNFSYDQILK